MKNKIAKILVILVAFVLPVLALAACTDKPRELDSVELSIVGTWKSGTRSTCEFRSDGTYDFNGNAGEFKHGDKGVETDGEARGHYEIINIHGGAFALFDSNPNMLVAMSELKPVSTDNTSNFIRQ